MCLGTQEYEEDYKVRDWQTVVWRPNLVTTTWCANTVLLKYSHTP